MFLNWVYRSTSPNSIFTVSGVSTGNIVASTVVIQPPSSGCAPVANQSTQAAPTVPEDWEGFQNIVWSQAPNDYEWGVPGDVRLVFINDVLLDLLSIDPQR